MRAEQAQRAVAKIPGVPRYDRIDLEGGLGTPDDRLPGGRRLSMRELPRSDAAVHAERSAVAWGGRSGEAGCRTFTIFSTTPVSNKYQAAKPSTPRMTNCDSLFA